MILASQLAKLTPIAYLHCSFVFMTKAINWCRNFILNIHKSILLSLILEISPEEFEFDRVQLKSQSFENFKRWSWINKCFFIELIPFVEKCRLEIVLVLIKFKSEFQESIYWDKISLDKLIVVNSFGMDCFHNFNFKVLKSHCNYAILLPEI